MSLAMIVWIRKWLRNGLQMCKAFYSGVLGLNRYTTLISVSMWNAMSAIQMCLERKAYCRLQRMITEAATCLT